MSAPFTDYYREWSTRLNHLETSRHALLAVHIAAVGYLTKESITPGAILHSDSYFAFWWVSLTFFLFHCFSALARNLFVKILLAAEQLMRIEYLTGVAWHGVGYYSSRVAKKKREDFVLLGYAPDVLTLGYFIVLLALFFRREAWVAASCAGIAVAAAAWRAKATYGKVLAAIAEKDAVELDLIQKEANKPPEPTSGSVTPRAGARVAPIPPVAHL